MSLISTIKNLWLYGNTYQTSSGQKTVAPGSIIPLGQGSPTLQASQNPQVTAPIQTVQNTVSPQQLQPTSSPQITAPGSLIQNAPGGVASSGTVQQSPSTQNINNILANAPSSNLVDRIKSLSVSSAPTNQSSPAQTALKMATNSNASAAFALPVASKPREAIQSILPTTQAKPQSNLSVPGTPEDMANWQNMVAQSTAYQKGQTIGTAQGKAEPWYQRFAAAFKEYNPLKAGHALAPTSETDTSFLQGRNAGETQGASSGAASTLGGLAAGIAATQYPILAASKFVNTIEQANSPEQVVGATLELLLNAALHANIPGAIQFFKSTEGNSLIQNIVSKAWASGKEGGVILGGYSTANAMQNKASLGQTILAGVEGVFQGLALGAGTGAAAGLAPRPGFDITSIFGKGKNSEGRYIPTGKGILKEGSIQRDAPVLITGPKMAADDRAILQNYTDRYAKGERLNPTEVKDVQRLVGHYNIELTPGKTAAESIGDNLSARDANLKKYGTETGLKVNIYKKPAETVRNEAGQYNGSKSNSGGTMGLVDKSSNDPLLSEARKYKTPEEFVNNLPKSKGKDVLGRDIPVWKDQIVYHSTSTESAKNIQKNGWKVSGSDEQMGYYGNAISVTPQLEYTKQFGDVLTVNKVDPSAKILNLNDPKDWEIFQKVTSNKDVRGFREAITRAGYDGVYDPGAGDLFIYNDRVLKNIAVTDNKTYNPTDIWQQANASKPKGSNYSMLGLVGDQSKPLDIIKQIDQTKRPLDAIQAPKADNTLVKLPNITKSEPVKITEKTTKPVYQAPEPVGHGKETPNSLYQRVKGDLLQFEGADAGAPTHNVAHLDQQARAAASLVTKDYEGMVSALRGERPMPKILPNALSTAVANEALARGDFSLASEIIRKMDSSATAKGQDISFLQTVGRDTPVGAIADVTNSRVKSVEKKMGSKYAKLEQTTVAKIKAEAKPTKHDWGSFVESLRCP